MAAVVSAQNPSANERVRIATDDLVARDHVRRLNALDRTGKRIEIDASGFSARVIQHETDHLDGILFIDRLDDATRKEAMRPSAKRTGSATTHPSSR